MKKRVVVTGIGCLSPIGNDTETLWENLIEGNSGVDYITHFDTSDLNTQIGAELKDFNPSNYFDRKEARRMDKYSQYAIVAVLQAVESADLNIDDGNRDRIGAIISSGIGGLETLETQIKVREARGPKRVSPFTVPMMLVDSAGGLVAIRLGIRGPNMAVVSACASGTNAVGEGAEIIKRGDADVMIVGGSEAPFTPISIAGMGVMTALSTRNDEPQRASRPFDLERDGFVMGEGSGILVIESLEHAQSRGATILAEITGYGTTNDAYHISAPEVTGYGAQRSMTLALEDAGLSPRDIGYINAHGTSTPLNDKIETKAIKTVFGEDAYNTPISSTKSMTGHLMGASGGLEALISVLVLQHSILPPTINYENPDPECDLDYVPNTARQLKVDHVMSNSFGFGGHNATIILSRNGENRV